MHSFRPLPAAIAAALAFLTFETAFAQAPPNAPPPPVTVAKPVVKEVVEYDDYTGRFEAAESVDVRSRVSGYLEAVHFRDGSLVRRGDLLFVIDRRQYQASVDQARAAVASARSRVAFAQADYERAQALGRTGNITEQVLEQRRQTLDIARADQQAAEAAVRTAELNLGFSEIRAPMGGRIGRKLISEGNLVTADQTLLTTIVSLDPIYFYFDVDERSYLSYMRNAISLNGAQPVANDGARQPVVADVGSQLGDVLVGVSDEREPKRKARLDFTENRLDQQTGTIRARAVVPNPDLFLTPGLFGTIRIPGSPRYQGVLVPDEAVATDQDRRFVWVVAEDGTASQRTVRPGPRIDGYRLVREGLKGDESVVIAGLQRVRPGAKVTPQMKELPPSRDAPPSQARAQVQ
ncbi:MAG TPA: efflux RND transporter periplasmic adaptor subunit [Beijerinckiaceae bacterium]